LGERIHLFRVPLGDSLRRLGRTPRAAWGMTLAHAGLAITIAGITGAGVWKVESIQSLMPGQSVSLSGFDFKFQGVKQIQGPNYQATRATFTVTQDGKAVVTLHPEKRLYVVQNQPTTEAAIHSTIWGDLYAVIGDPEGTKGAYVTRLYFNPLVVWMWIGVMMMMLGAAMSLSDRRYRIGAPKRTRQRIEGAAATSLK
jgi:cytochrome c-type biogenesis protein CcmF